MDFTIDKATQARLERVHELGKNYIRPLGLECDRLGRPLPPEHDYFKMLHKMGMGRTRWRPKKPGEPKKKKDTNKPGNTRSTLLVSEEMSYWDRGVAVSGPSPGLGEGPLIAMGTEEQKERFLGPFINPDRPRWAAFAMTEPGAGSDVAGIRTRCVKDGKHWILNGNKSFSGASSRADWILVWATIDPALGRDGHRAFIVEKGTPGLGNFHIEKKTGIKGYESTSFVMSDCRVPEENLVGGEEYYTGGKGFKGAMKTFNSTRPMIAAMAVGMARAAVDEAMRFARDNDLLGDVRVRDRLERMHRKVKMCRLLTFKAAWLADHQMPNIVEASMCKALAPQVGMEAASLGMELLGLVGGRGDHLIEKLYRDMKAMDIVEGTGQIQRVVMARQLVGFPN